MTQILMQIDDDVRMELGIPLGCLWIGRQWSEEAREEWFRCKYPRRYR